VTAVAAASRVFPYGRTAVRAVRYWHSLLIRWGIAQAPWPGQTIGNKLLNIRVVRTNGSDLTISQALIRYIGLFISVLCLFIGVIWAAFDPNKQGWHDKIADTYVITTS
jgi:uncharacterized RDD family membrane protein YckC